MNPPTEPAAAAALLSQMPLPWRLSAAQRRQLAPAVAEALAASWRPSELLEHLSAGSEGVRNHFAVLRSRLADLPDARPHSAPAQPRPALPDWCGECEGPELAQRWRMVQTRSSGHPSYGRCTTCHPEARASA